MSSTDWTTINQALYFVWASNSEFSLPTQYENTEYEPVKGTAWARLSVVPSDSYVVTLGTGGEDEHIGLLFIDLFYPPGDGWGTAMAKADAIRDAYKAGTSGSSGDIALQIVSCSRSGGRVEDGWYRITLEIEWRARTARPV